MGQKHKHAEIIKAWADGAEIQINVRKGDDWEDINPKCVVWADEYEYRIKPEQKPDVVIYLLRKMGGARLWGEIDLPPLHGKTIRLILDGETGEPKSAEVIS